MKADPHQTSARTEPFSQSPSPQAGLRDARDFSCTPRGKLARAHYIVFTALLWAVSASAATITSTWSGGATGNWSLPGNWTPNGVPNNGADIYNVNIPSPSAVTIDGVFSIQSIDVDTGATAQIIPGFLTVNADSTLDGVLRMGVDGNFATARLRFAANVTLSGSGTVELNGNTSIEGGPVTIAAGITMQTGTWPNGGPLIDADLTSAGPININNPNFAVIFPRTLTSTGSLHLSANAKLTSVGATVALQNNVTQLDAGSEINGGVILNDATVNGPGGLRPNALNLIGTSTINAPIETDLTTIVVSGDATLNGSGPLIIRSTTPLNAAEAGATFATGPNFAINVASGQTFSINLPTRLQGLTTVTSGVLVLASDLDNDGTIQLTGTATMRVNANANVVAGSTGTIHVGEDAKIEANGPSTLGGLIELSGILQYKSGITTALGDVNADGNGDISVDSGATAQFARLVPNLGTLTVNDNGSASFNGGLAAVGAATVTGSTAVFNVTGSTTATGVVRVLGEATHGGAGTTTTQNQLFYDGKLDGRTLVAQGATTGLQVTLQNNALFINQGTYTFRNFGEPGTITGNGIFRNSGTLTQPADGVTNTISTDFEQTATGNITARSTIELNGNSTVAGTIPLQQNGTVVFGAGAADTTHTVSAAITGPVTGTGTVDVKGNLATGNAPTVTITGPISGPNTAVRVLGGATVQLAQQPQMPLKSLEIADSTVTTSNLIRFFVTLLIIRDGTVGGSLTVLDVENGTLTGNNTFDSLTLNARAIIIQDTLDLKREAQLAIMEIARFRDDAQVRSSTRNGSVRVAAGGTASIEAPATIATSVVVEPGGKVIAQNNIALNVSGSDGGTFAISGTLTAANGSVVRLTDNAVLTNNADGVIEGNGTLDVSAAGSTFANNGETKPGMSAGVLTIIGNTPFSGTAKLSIEIGGTTVGTQYDRLAITSGSASLDGTLSISLINTFTPAPTDSFTILTATAGVTGVFDNAATQVSFSGGMFDVTYLPNSIVLSNFAIPEPGSVVFAALGAALLLVRKTGRRCFTNTLIRERAVITV